MIMASATPAAKKRRRPVMRWVRRGFLLWALVATLWLANSYRTQGVDPALLASDAAVTVANGDTTLNFSPVAATSETALIFICGSGVAAEAYAPLLRPVAEAGHAVFIVKLPYRFAPLESHKQAAVDRALGVIAAHPRIRRWVLAGHSLGGALACRAVQSDCKAISGLVLVGTTHPKEEDLSSLSLPVTKVYGSNDGVAPPDRMFANRGLLPKETRWVEIKGGNHSQFGHYGHQLLDGKSSTTREAQQAATRAALLEMLKNVAK
jgi:pimeloyl-ACP methyl ester carboxylesterase